MGIAELVKNFYSKDAWTTEEGLDKQRKFVSGATEGWIGTLRERPSPATVLTDARDGGVGTVSPTLDTDGNAIAEMAGHAGDYVIDIHGFEPGTPDPADAKTLLLQQLESLRGSKNTEAAVG